MEDNSSTADVELAKIKAAINAGVPTDSVLGFASRLNGSTPEELQADAEQAMTLFEVKNPRAIDPSAGLGAGSGDAASDGSEFADYILSLLD